MISRANLNEYLNETIRKAFNSYQRGVLVIRADQKGAPLPTCDIFASVKVRGVGDLSHPDVSYQEDGDGLQEIVSSYESFVVSINVFSIGVADQQINELNPNDLLTGFKIYLRSSEGRQDITARYVGVVRFSDIRDLAGIENQQWEERSQLDITINASVVDIFQINDIKTANIVGEVQAKPDSFPITIQTT